MSKENCEREARQKIAASIGALPEEIYFWKSGWSPKGIKSSDKSIEKGKTTCDHYDDGRSRSVR